MDQQKNHTMGKLKKITAEHGIKVPEGVWRIDKKLAGGGPLMDVGIYCVQAAIYTAGEEPVAVTATEKEKTDAKKFNEVEEALTWKMEFASGAITECKTSYSETQNLLRAEFENGWMQLKPAFPYSGIKADTNNGKIKLTEINQQAFQMDDFAVCVKNNKKSKLPGEMGLRDVQIMLAIYEAMNSGKRVEI
jgi:predicted dehydrogenase